MVTMLRHSAAVLAARIAEDLFTNGQGEHAERLVLWRDSTNENLGGWAQRAVADRVERILRDSEREARG